MRKLGFIIFLSACSFLAHSQLDNRLFEDRLALEESDSGKLFLGLNFLGFSKNNEYFNTIVEGYTMLGYQLNPTLSYHLSRNIRLDAGAYVQKDFGNNNFSTIAPTLTLKITKGSMALLFGNLEGSLNHRLIEPLYDFERLLDNRLETGIQFQTIRDDLFLDMWIDWQKMIYNNDPEQERFVSGLSLHKQVIKGTWPLSVITQLLVSHRGGQINVNSPPLETVMNSAVGLEVQREAIGLVKRWTFNGFYVYYSNVSTSNERPYKDGVGVYFNANASTDFGLDVMASYWQGHEYLSIQGGKIYPSVSVFDNRIHRENMQLMLLRFLYQKSILDGLNLALRFEPHYDLGFNAFQYAYGFYIQFNDRFFLTRRK